MRSETVFRREFGTWNPADLEWTNWHITGSDCTCRLVFIDTSPMSGYIRGSAKQRGRAALASTPIFNAGTVVPLDLDSDDQGELTDQESEAPIVVLEKTISDSLSSYANSESASSGFEKIDQPTVAFNRDPGIDSKRGNSEGSAAQTLRIRRNAETSREGKPTGFTPQPMENSTQTRIGDRFFASPTPNNASYNASSLVIPWNYAVLILLFVVFMIGMIFVMGRGNYHYIRLEIGGFNSD